MSKPDAKTKGFVVVLAEDLGDEEAETVRATLAEIDGVLAVTKIMTTDQDVVALARARAELGVQIFNLLYYEKPDG